MLPHRARHTGEWPLDAPRRAPPESKLRELQDSMPSCGNYSAVLSGDGTERAMLIGQAPGRREIETGLPFAHDAGKRLIGWLSLASITVHDFRQRWYVTSVGKCYPGGRDGASVDSPPTRAEIRRWSPYLDEEVRLVGPGLVVLVGGVAHRYALGEQARLEDMVGHELRWGLAPQATTVALPHPSGASTWMNDPAHVELWRASIEVLGAAWSALDR